MGDRRDFSLLQLRYFVAAAEAGSMTAAAADLVVSQSAVSTSISQLEHQLGLSLFVRHHARGLSLTPSGRRLLVEARSLLAHAEDVSDAARGLGAELSGTLAVGCFLTLSPIYLPRLITEMEARHPAVSLQVTEGETSALRESLLTGKAELALMYAYDPSARDGLRYDVLTSAEPYVILPRQHRLARRSRVRLRELADEPMVLYDLPQSRDYFADVAAHAGVKPLVRYRSSNYETVRALVASGHGYSILNQRPAFDTTYDGGSLVKVALGDALQPLAVALARAEGVGLTRRAAALTAIAREVIGGHRAQSKKTDDLVHKGLLYR